MLRYAVAQSRHTFRSALKQGSTRLSNVHSQPRCLATAASKAVITQTRELLATIRSGLQDVSLLLKDIDGHADWAAIQAEIEKLRGVLRDETAWINDTTSALKTQARLAQLEKQISTYQQIRTSYDALQDLASLAEGSEDEQMLEEIVPELEQLQATSDQYLISLWLSDPVDAKSAYVEIHAGSGGTEACDWASMLARMYTKWAHSRNFTVKVIDETPGDTAGIKGTTLLLEGPYAYGYAQYETGVHRLVRLSPFDKSNARHTSFASVRVSPCLDEDTSVDIDLNPADLRITTMRSQGAGGQHVNKTESAVRIVHVPTGITVACQQERSQHRNRTLALSLLRSRLYEIELQKRQQSKADSYNALPENAWGSQIRSYTLQPYQLIKDTRTGYEAGSGAVQRVLDGSITGFMEASLRKYKKR
ncbi:release factor [Obba rivulosa]|uniref:Release factor n=1 Tax=Obba rivulosa TaxID=1052685 RepID=A0A8E2DQ02_9APHY|nr:release factor [Obba rivulosa]